MIESNHYTKQMKDENGRSRDSYIRKHLSIIFANYLRNYRELDVISYLQSVIEIERGCDVTKEEVRLFLLDASRRVEAPFLP